MTQIGNRIYKDFPRPSPELIEAFRGIPSSNINDMINRLFCMRDCIRPMNKVPLCGPAFTVHVPMGDNLYFHHALDLAKPGDVIVVDGEGGINRSLTGEIMLTYAAKRGISGVVIDGCIRDYDGIQNLPLSVYAIGVTPQGPFKNGPGEINVPISCGGQVVFPGDIIVGDGDGIVVVRRQDAEEILALGKEKKSKEDAAFDSMRSHLDEYTKIRLKNVSKWSEGKDINWIDGSFADVY